MSLYETLGISETANTDEIKKSFRKLSMQYHPDKPDGDSDKYKAITNAYSILSDTQKRKEYDIQQKMSSFTNTETDDFDIFNMLFGGARMGQGMPFSFETDSMHSSPNIRIFRNGKPMFSNIIQKPQPVVVHCMLTLEESYTGTSKHINIKRWIMKNNTKTEEHERYYIDIPNGIDENEIIIIQNKGHVQTDILKGDVKVIIHIKQHPTFKRHGIDLLYTKKLSFKESLCGFQFTLSHIDGKQYNINNQPGKVIKPGFHKIISNMGFKRNDNTGRLIIEFEIEYPETLSSHVLNTLTTLL